MLTSVLAIVLCKGPLKSHCVDKMLISKQYALKSPVSSYQISFPVEGTDLTHDTCSMRLIRNVNVQTGIFYSHTNTSNRSMHIFLMAKNRTDVTSLTIMPK